MEIDIFGYQIIVVNGEQREKDVRRPKLKIYESNRQFVMRVSGSETMRSEIVVPRSERVLLETSTDRELKLKEHLSVT